MIDKAERNRKFVEDYNAGKTIGEIARAAGLTNAAIRYHLKKFYGKRFRPKLGRYRADPVTHLHSRLRYLPEQLERAEAKLERLRAEARQYGLIQ